MAQTPKIVTRVGPLTIEAISRSASERAHNGSGVPSDEDEMDGKEHEIQTFLALQVSKASIAKITGVDCSTLYHFIRSRGLMQK